MKAGCVGFILTHSSECLPSNLGGILFQVL